MTDEGIQKRQRTLFEANAKHVDAFWKTVGGLYLTAGLFSFAQPKKDSGPPTQADVKAWTESIQALVQVLKTSEQAKPNTNPNNQGKEQGKQDTEAAEPKSSPTQPPPPAEPAK